MAKNAWRIATRKSQLALWQAERVQTLLAQTGEKAEILKIVTTGDKLQKNKLANTKIDAANPHHTTGKGLFVKEIQEAILKREAHIAVHSMKDLPTRSMHELRTVALLERADPRDVIILESKLVQDVYSVLKGSVHEGKNLDELPTQIVLDALQAFNFRKGIGTVSARRSMLALGIFPDAHIFTLRGNVDTRLKRVSNGDYSATFLARAGLERLNLFNPKYMHTLDLKLFNPAPAQGTIALETHVNNQELIDKLITLNHMPTCATASLERLTMQALGGDCQTALAIHAHVGDDITIKVDYGMEESVKASSLTLSADSTKAIKKIVDTPMPYFECHDKIAHSGAYEEITAHLKEHKYPLEQMARGA